MSDAPPAKKQAAGAPAWVMTFADLMSLLMCFFVLLFSFSEMDVSKYKQIAGSMNEAFGVQREVKVKQPPRGLRVIANEFSPGRPEPTPLNVVRQNTTNELKRFLDMGKNQSRRDKVGALGKNNRINNVRRRYEDDVDPTKSGKTDLRSADAQAQAQDPNAVKQGGNADISKDQKGAEGALNELQASQFQKISKALELEILDGKVDVELKDKDVVIRIREKASFPSGDADLRPDFHYIVVRIAQVLEETEGNIVVGGHTDDVPIHNSRFRSNWDLSAARAASLVHAILGVSEMRTDRFRIAGFADTQPISPSTSWESRSLNRRVEVVLEQATLAGLAETNAADMNQGSVPDVEYINSTYQETVPDGR